MKKIFCLVLSLVFLNSNVFAMYVSEKTPLKDYSQVKEEYMDMAEEYLKTLYDNNIPSTVVKNIDGTYDWSKFDGNWSSIKWDFETYEKFGPQNPVWRYQNGSMMKAFVDYYNVTEDKAYLDFATNYMEYDYYTGSFWDTNLDSVNPGKGILDLYDVYVGNNSEAEHNTLLNKAKTVYNTLKGAGRIVDNGNENAYEYTYSDEDNNLKTAYTNNFEHKPTYDKQVWLDGLYMALPFYTHYVTKYSGEELFDEKGNITGSLKDIYQQLQFVHYNLKDVNGLYHHGYDHSRKTVWSKNSYEGTPQGVAPIVWLRAIGWYAMAQVDVIELFPECNEKEVLKEQFKKFIDTMLKYQDETGMWYQVVDEGIRQDNYLETSGTAGLSSAILKGVNLGYLPEEYYIYGETAFYGIVSQYLIDNSLGGICRVASLGTAYGDYEKDYAYYVDNSPLSVTRQVKDEAKGIAPFMFAYTQILKHNKADNDDIPGDVNGDNILTALDASTVLSFVLNADSFDFTTEQKNICDMDKNSEITAKDASIILSMVLNKDFSIK